MLLNNFEFSKKFKITIIWPMTSGDFSKSFWIFIQILAAITLRWIFLTNLKRSNRYCINLSNTATWFVVIVFYHTTAYSEN